MMIYIKDEDGYDEISDTCAECEHSYVDDLFNEWCCRRKKCKYTEAERKQIIRTEEMFNIIDSSDLDQQPANSCERC